MRYFAFCVCLGMISSLSAAEPEDGEGEDKFLGNPRQVTKDGVDAENPTQTKDGRAVVYSSSNPAQPGIWRIAPDGSAAAHLTGGAYINPEVSPDGRYALAVQADYSALRNTVQVIDVSTGKFVDFRIDLSYGPLSANVTY